MSCRCTHAGRAVKQDRVPLGLPNCCQPDATGTVQTEEDAAHLFASHQDLLSDFKAAACQFILFAQSEMDVCPDIMQALNVEEL